MSISYAFTDSPVGRVIMCSDGHQLTGLYFEGQKYMPSLTTWQHNPTLPLFVHVSAQLHEYFNGARRHFSINYGLLGGTPFQQKVWQALAKVPYGQLTSYKMLAHVVGLPQAARAVGAAVGRNPLSVIVPCHRVVGSNGALTGYAGGLERKKNLLMIEKLP